MRKNPNAFALKQKLQNCRPLEQNKNNFKKQIPFKEWNEDQISQKEKEKNIDKYTVHKLLRPGKHFLFFIKGGRHFMLSENLPYT